MSGEKINEAGKKVGTAIHETYEATKEYLQDAAVSAEVKIQEAKQEAERVLAEGTAAAGAKFEEMGAKLKGDAAKQEEATVVEVPADANVVIIQPAAE